MANLKVKCPTCNKDVLVKKEFTNDFFKKRYSLFECGHSTEIAFEVSPTADIDSIVSRIGHSPYKYQSETVQFIEKAGLRGIINHEMGLGKMVIECLLLKRNFDELIPALIIPPAGITRQWFAHIINWVGVAPQILTTARPNPDFDFYKIFICSVDTLHRLPWMQTRVLIKTRKDLKEWEHFYKKISNEPLRLMQSIDIDTPEKREIRSKFKHICVDEVQRIKNNTAKRTQAVKEIGSARKVITLSGTPIKNNAAEYFPCLNLVMPDIFPTEAGFIKRFVRMGSYGKAYGMQNVERFQELTSDYIIRFERKDKLPDLPAIWRQYQTADMEDRGAQKAYESELEGFLDFMDNVNEGNGPGNSDMTNILGYFARMRHITGLAKVEPTVKYIEEFLLSTDRKITIFVHHKDVAEMIKLHLEGICKDGALNPSLVLNASMSADERFKTIGEFYKPGNRILIASTLAAGEGINLQCCSDCLIVERQWNPANEEQAEARFPRPGNTSDKINAVYMISAGTIDEFLTELVERKRSIMKQVLDGTETKWDESSLMRDLMNELTSKGKSKWKASLI